MEAKMVQPFGNSGHVILPKEYVGKRMRFLVEPKTIQDVKEELFQMLLPHIEKVEGVYLYGSYARNEQTASSDVDALILASEKFPLPKKQNYSILILTKEELEAAIEKRPILILPIIREAKGLLHGAYLERYKEMPLKKTAIIKFLDETAKILAINRQGAALSFETGSLVYSLILRIRSMVIIQCLLQRQPYSKNELYSILEKGGLSKVQVNEAYAIYANEREGRKVGASRLIREREIRKLLTLAGRLIEEVKAA